MTIYNNNKDNDSKYPIITDRLIEALTEDFPDTLPRVQKSEYELGILVGKQLVIDKLKLEKLYQEEK